jgi:hypothetical protein
MVPARALAAAAIALAGVAAAEPRPQPTPAAVEAELRRITQEMLDAIAPGHVEVWQRTLHERVLHVDETGAVRGKAELLREIQPLPAGLVGRIEVDAFRVVLHGDTAVVAHEDQEHLDYHGQVLRSRFRAVDTWLRTPEGWRLIAAQVSAVLKDPPSIRLTAEQLCAYNGTYALTPAITATVRCAGDGLAVERAGRPPATYVPEVADVFFAAGQPRTRRIFQRDPQGKVVGFVDRREGEDVRWTRQP